MVLALSPSPAGIRRPQAASTPAAASSSAARLHAARPAAAARRRLQRAAAEKEGGATQQADGEQLRVPDTPPAPAGAGAASSSSSSAQQQPPASAASQLNQVCGCRAVVACVGACLWLLVWARLSPCKVSHATRPLLLLSITMQCHPETDACLNTSILAIDCTAVEIHVGAATAAVCHSSVSC